MSQMGPQGDISGGHRLKSAIRSEPDIVARIEEAGGLILYTQSALKADRAIRTCHPRKPLFASAQEAAGHRRHRRVY